MLARQRVICQLSAFALLVSLYAVSLQTTQARDSSDRAAVVTWSADLNGNNETPAVSTAARATAEFTFDFHARTATFQITPENLQNVATVLLLVKGAEKNLKGAPVLTLYNAAEGPGLSKAYTKTFANDAFKEIANAVLNGTGVVEVTTKAHPDGEISGVVQMHKSYR
jgi:hypothetical protein